MCEQVFYWNDDDKAEAISDHVPADLEQDAREAVDSCPTEAIKEV
jgi:ferredoxin